MLQTEFHIAGLASLPEVATQIISIAGEKKIFCFYGELGAGKTTLIKEICKQLGVTDSGSSPTFSLVNEYYYSSHQKEYTQHKTSTPSVSSLLRRPDEVLYHFDLYRLKDESEIFDIGYEDYLYSGNYCFIEWPEKMEHLLPKGTIKVKIEVKDSERLISVE